MNSIATDLTYLIRDNQFWTSECEFEELILDADEITVDIEGLGVRTLRRANNYQSTGERTNSFLFPESADVDWWREHNRERIRIDLLEIDP